MQSTRTLAFLFQHHLWANLRLLDACEKLSDPQLDAAVAGGFGTIRDTWQHIARAERSYFSRISTGEPFQHPGDEAFSTLSKIRTSLEETGAGLAEWSGRVTGEETVILDWDGQPREVPKGVILSQAIVHAVEHRAQVMVILTQLGLEPPDLGAWVYFDETGREAES